MSRDRRELESLFRRARRDPAELPPFGRVWQGARELRRRRRSRRRLLLLAAVPLSAALLLVVLLVPAPESREPAPQSSDFPSSEASELARSLSDWRAPLDFLLEPPGGGLIGVDTAAAELPMPDALPDLDFEEVL